MADSTLSLLLHHSLLAGISEGNPLFHLLWSGSGVVLFILHACELLGKDKAGVGTVHRGLGGCRELHGSES